MTRRVVVTGGGTGIGRAVAERFVRDGCVVALVGRRPQVLEHAAQGLRALTPTAEVTTHVADLMSPESGAALAQDLAASGSVDVLVLNAGGTYLGSDETDDLVTPLLALAEAYREPGFVPDTEFWTERLRDNPGPEGQPAGAHTDEPPGTPPGGRTTRPTEGHDVISTYGDGPPPPKGRRAVSAVDRIPVSCQ